MKKAQIKMFESIAVLVVFFFILIVGLSFYSNIERNSILRTEDEFQQLKEVELAQIISSMPELECPTSLETENCIDKYKLEGLDFFFDDNKNFYFDIFGFSTIKVYEVSNRDSPLLYSIYDNPNGQSSKQTNIPVSIYDPINKNKLFGILEINVYS